MCANANRGDTSRCQHAVHAPTPRAPPREANSGLANTRPPDQTRRSPRAAHLGLVLFHLVALLLEFLREPGMVVGAERVVRGNQATRATHIHTYRQRQRQRDRVPHVSVVASARQCRGTAVANHARVCVGAGERDSVCVCVCGVQCMRESERERGTCQPACGLLPHARAWSLRRTNNH